ncbi:hypothetical protein Q0Z83_105320 [Actinoplanes sichuanensis]|nr:hypothetical protein Q0Z83_105320 [Actinoplanes sichuanensis]
MLDTRRAAGHHQHLGHIRREQALSQHTLTHHPGRPENDHPHVTSVPRAGAEKRRTPGLGSSCVS